MRSDETWDYIFQLLSQSPKPNFAVRCMDLETSIAPIVVYLTFIYGVFSFRYCE